MFSSGGLNGLGDGLCLLLESIETRTNTLVLVCMELVGNKKNIEEGLFIL